MIKLIMFDITTSQVNTVLFFKYKKSLFKLSHIVKILNPNFDFSIPYQMSVCPITGNFPRHISRMNYVIKPCDILNVYVEQLFPFDIETLKLTVSHKNDVILVNCDVIVSITFHINIMRYCSCGVLTNSIHEREDIPVAKSILLNCIQKHCFFNESPDILYIKGANHTIILKQS